MDPADGAEAGESGEFGEAGLAVVAGLAGLGALAADTALTGDGVESTDGEDACVVAEVGVGWATSASAGRTIVGSVVGGVVEGSSGTGATGWTDPASSSIGGGSPAVAADSPNAPAARVAAMPETTATVTSRPRSRCFTGASLDR